MTQENLSVDELNKIVEKILADLSVKQKKVIVKRFGFSGSGVYATLQDIGDELGVTRERVRQIETQAMIKVRNSVRKNAKYILEIANEHLEQSGGAERDVSFIASMRERLGVKSKKRVLENKIRFLLRVAGKPSQQKETSDFWCFWYADDKAKRSVFSCIEKAKDIFATRKKNKTIDKNKFVNDDEKIDNYKFLLISRHFGVSPFGDIGPVHWPEILPKNIRDKAYLTIRKHSGPMHFEEISEKIWEFGVSKKPVNTQTVHNELIKDNRFVLIGRGVYGLREHGYEPGTVREVIGNLIRSKGPLTREQVVELTKEKRVLKDNTVLLNLQNRKHFTRQPDGRYIVREA